MMLHYFTLMLTLATAVIAAQLVRVCHTDRS
jgi:hypothetical protein